MVSELFHDQLLLIVISANILVDQLHSLLRILQHKLPHIVFHSVDQLFERLILHEGYFTGTRSLSLDLVK